MTNLRPRFYQEARPEPADGGFRLLLDGKAVKTPKGRPLLVPTAALAEALAAEWNALADRIDPERLPLTRLSNTVIDGTAENRSLMLADLRRYAGGDLLCYRGEPEALAAREAEAWDPLLDWARTTHGAALAVTTGVVHCAQPDAALDALTEAAARLDDFALTALHMAAGLTGSLVIALALADRRLDAAAAWRVATVDEDYQAELWGVDAEAKARSERLAAELAQAERFLRLLNV